MDKTITYDDLATELARVIRKGLPVTDTSAGDVLPHLRCVTAHAIHPDARLSRITALNDVLEDLLRDLGDTDEAGATRILFALADRHRGTTLTRRRELIASELGYNPDHVRQYIEKQLLRIVALQLGKLNAQYQPRAHLPPPEEITGDTPALTNDDYTAHEELASRLWSLIYALRADLIAIKREAEAGERTRKRTMDSALWETAQLLALIDTYIDQYGERILHGEVEYAAERLIRLAGWHPPFSDEENQRLRLTLVRGVATDRNNFLKRLRGSQAGRDLQTKWRKWMGEFAEERDET